MFEELSLKAIVVITHGIVQKMYKKSVAEACEENHGSVITGDGAFDFQG